MDEELSRLGALPVPWSPWQAPVPHRPCHDQSWRWPRGSRVRSTSVSELALEARGRARYMDGADGGQATYMAICLMNQKKEPTCRCRWARRRIPGGFLLSHTVSHAVPSTPASLTTEFGMGSGVASPPWPPEKPIPNSKQEENASLLERARAPSPRPPMGGDIETGKPHGLLVPVR